MARGPPILSSQAPTIAPATVTIGHVQLRDLIICPHERGLVNYVHNHSIVEHDVKSIDSVPRVIADLTFLPNTLASLQLPNTNNTLLAAGGQDAEIHLSLHSSSDSGPSKQLWHHSEALSGSINNSVLLTSMSLTRSHESSIEPRLGISNNDCTVKFYDIPIASRDPRRTPKEVGALRLDVPVNHSSISPDGRTLLSVGDSSTVYLHRLTGGSRITFSPITTLAVPPSDTASPLSSALAASFSTAFSSNGSKFAVASQEGVVAVWDVRSSKPLKVYQTDKTRSSGGKIGNGMASGWLSDDPWDWTRGGSKAPGWGARNVKFGAGGHSGNPGREVMTFTEHTSLVHIIDARTFETEEIVHVPGSSGNTHVPTLHSPRSHSVSPRYHYPSSRYRTSGPPHITRTLEEALRIHSGRRASATSEFVYPDVIWNTDPPGGEYLDGEDVVVIPPLGDRAVENDVRALLGRHGIRARPAESLDQPHNGVQGREHYGFSTREPESDEEMEVDELEETDCVDAPHTPSRSSSPSPSATRRSPTQTLSPHRARRRREGLQTAGAESDMDLDLAGTCFDPSGGYLYVASSEGIAEWSMRGAEKRWWDDTQWA